MADRVVIVGGGFAGLNAARGLRRADVNITLIDRTNHHLFQPLLYQVATGGLSPADIATPVRHILRKQKNVEVVLGEAKWVDPAGRVVVLDDGTKLPYDTLVLACGAATSYFGNDRWAEHSHGLKTLADATRIRAEVLTAFEQAERDGNKNITFMVVGAGPTGLEMAGTIAEMARHTLRRDFRHIDPAKAQVLLIEADTRVLPTFPEKLSRKAKSQLEELGATVMTRTKVVEVAAAAVTIEGPGGTKRIKADTLIWAAGVAASPLGAALDVAGADIRRDGKVVVNRDLTVAGHPEILVVGDLAWIEAEGGEAVPGVAPAAIQMGRYAAKLIRRRLAGKAMKPFVYKDKGTLATIGRNAAVADIGRLHFSGFPAWVAWLAIHIFFLIGFQNRVLVMIQWAGNYFTRNRSARLIVEYPDGRRATTDD
jgi:NADH dehydrogenase